MSDKAKVVRLTPAEMSRAIELARQDVARQAARIATLENALRACLGDKYGNPPGLYALGLAAMRADSYSSEERDVIAEADRIEAKARAALEALDDEKIAHETTTAAHTITIMFIVGGEEVPVEANVEAPLQVARDLALEKSHNTGRPFADWQVFTELGLLLASESPVATIVDDFRAARCARLLLSPKAGVGAA